MVRHRHEWLLIETSSGTTIATQRDQDGEISWKEVSHELSERCARAVVVSSSDCRGRGITVKDMKKFQMAALRNSTADVSLESYAERAYTFASGKSLQEPPDARGEAPIPAKSHSGGLKIEFNLRRFQAFDPSTVRVEPVEAVDSRYRMFGGRCLLLRNVLTAEECKYLIQEMSRDMAPVRYHHDYRSNDRCIFDSSELAELLYHRVQPVAAQLAVSVEEYPTKQRLLAEEPGSDCPEELHVGYGKEGVWHATGLNPCLRFCKYNAGGFFRKHCDAMYARSEEERSLFTCMFYLNGDFEGGATRFLHIEDRSGCMGDQYKLAPDDQVLASVAPETGSCILFFQPGLMHEGEDLYAGEKYILRTDVIFERDPATKPCRTPQQIEAARLVQEASAAEERKECDLACSLYRRAFKLDPKLERLF